MARYYQFHGTSTFANIYLIFLMLTGWGSPSPQRKWAGKSRNVQSSCLLAVTGGRGNSYSTLLPLSDSTTMVVSPPLGFRQLGSTLLILLGRGRARRPAQTPGPIRAFAPFKAKWDLGLRLHPRQPGQDGRPILFAPGGQFVDVLLALLARHRVEVFQVG
jgi:hypothetical protein